MTDVTFGHKELLYPAGGPIDFVYFPRGGARRLTATRGLLGDGQYRTKH